MPFGIAAKADSKPQPAVAAVRKPTEKDEIKEEKEDDENDCDVDDKVLLPKPEESITKEDEADKNVGTEKRANKKKKRNVETRDAWT